MDQVHSILTGFVPAQSSSKSAKAYDAAAKQHAAALTTSSAEIQSAVLSNPGPLLETVDPSTHSIGYLMILKFLLSAPETDLPISQTALLDAILEFLMKFDPIQIRYAGQPMLALLTKVGSGQLFSPIVAVELLSTALLRLDPSGSVFTSTHLLLAKLAYDSNSTEPAMRVINRDILFYPNMAGSRDARPLSDPSLPPTSYISTGTGLTDQVKSFNVLEYNYYRGMIYMSRRDWSAAQLALEQSVSHPCKDKAVSKMMVEAYKRWVLVGLLNKGKAPSVPSSATSTAKSCYSTACKPYNNIAVLFDTAKAAELKKEVEDNASVWEEDATTTLVAEVLSAYQKWQIINLRQIYQRVAMEEVRQSTLSADTGEPLADPQAVLALVTQMIESGMLRGRLEQDEDRIYLAFEEGDETLSEAAFAQQIAQSHHNVDTLAKQFRVMSDRLSVSKEYVRHMAKEQKLAEKGVGDAGIGFDSQIEDEDLMSGIMAHS